MLTSTALTPWENLIRRKEASANVEERRSIFVGLDIDSQAPVCIPRSALEGGHYHILGMTRSGRTSAALLPLVLQILRGYRDKQGRPSEPCPIVIFDLKGDQAMFNATWSAANAAGRRFRFLSTRVGDDYHFFDPFQMFKLGHMLPLQLATEFVRAFSLDYGLIYGGLYYTQQNLVVLDKAIEELLQRRNTEPTIADLSRILHRLARSSHSKDADHIDSCLSLLARYPQVNVALHGRAPAQQINLLRALDDAEVIYFFLEMEDQAPSLRQVASLALYTLVQAAKYRYREGQPQRHTYVLIDEFYHIAGKSFGELLSTVAEWGLHFVLANQSRRQLENHDAALPDVVATNTAVQQAFTFLPEDEAYFLKASGEARDFLRSTSVDPYGALRRSASEYVATHLTDADLKRVHDTNLASLMLIHDDKPRPQGRRVLKVQSLYPLSREAHEAFRAEPLPKRPLVGPPFPLANPPPPPRDSTSRERSTLDDAEGAELQRRMQEVWRRLETDEHAI